MQLQTHNRLLWVWRINCHTVKQFHLFAFKWLRTLPCCIAQRYTAARLLNVPVLDFDVYARTRDSDAVAADLVPAVVAWLARVMY